MFVFGMVPLYLLCVLKEFIGNLTELCGRLFTEGFRHTGFRTERPKVIVLVSVVKVNELFYGLLAGFDVSGLSFGDFETV
jgi:hypothetical protein